MDQNNPATVETPSDLLLVDAPHVADAATRTCVRSFADSRHLLSGKPLRRPNRTRPLDADEPSSGLTTAETYLIQERAALAVGWDDPELDAYGNIDAPQ